LLTQFVLISGLWSRPIDPLRILLVRVLLDKHCNVFDNKYRTNINKHTRELSSSNLKGVNLQLDPIVLQYLIDVKTNGRLQPSNDVVEETT